MNTKWTVFLQGRSGVDLGRELSPGSHVLSGALCGAGDSASRSLRPRSPAPGAAPRPGGRPLHRFRLIPLVSLLARR